MRVDWEKQILRTLAPPPHKPNEFEIEVQIAKWRKEREGKNARD